MMFSFDGMISRFINAGGFAFILICFILPFISVKCNNTTLVTIKGYDMVFGKKNYLGVSDNPFGQKDDNNTTETIEPGMETTPDAPAEKEDDDQHLKPSPLMIVLMLLAVTGIIVAFAARASHTGVAGLVLSGLFLLVLLIFVISMNSKANGESSELMGIIRIGYEIGFWLMLVTSLLLIGYNLFEILNALQKAKLSTFQQE